MDERLASCIAVPAAEIAAGAALLALFPANPLSAPYGSLLQYLGGRIPILLLCWIALGAILWLFRPNLLRPRRHSSSKLTFLGVVCLAGVVIDNAATFDLCGLSPAVLGDSLILRSMAVRTATYILCFGMVVGATYLIETRRPANLTPPPRFGRH